MEHGSSAGVPVVLLHAYADSWRSFERVLPFLPSSIRALAPTQRGHGDASKPPAGYAVEDFVDDLESFLEMLGIDEAVLVASSSAAFTVERLAVTGPERVLGLLFIGVPWSLAERTPSFGFVEMVAQLTDPVDPEFVGMFVLGTSSEQVPSDFLERMAAESGKVPAYVWQQTLTGLLDAPCGCDPSARSSHLGRSGRARPP